MVEAGLRARTFFAVTLCVTAQLTAAAALRAQAPSSSYALLCSGSDDSLWVLLGKWKPHEQGTYDNWLAYFEKASSQIRAIPGPLPQSGRPELMALAGTNLHVFFAGGTHYRYTTRDDRRELRLTDAARAAVIPEALAGESVDRATKLWAVVKTATADAVAEQYEKVLRLRATQPAETQPAPLSATRPGIGPRSEHGYHMVSYDGQAWRPEFAAPIESADKIWLAVSGGRVHLLWQAARHDEQIQYAWHEAGRWTSGPPIALASPPAAAFLGIGNRHLVFIAMSPRERSRWQPLACMRPEREGPWTATPALQSADGRPLIVPEGSAAGVFGDQVAIVRVTGEKPEVGLWQVSGGRPEQNFAELPQRRSILDPAQRGRRDLRIALALGALLLVVFWLRHTTFAAPVMLPPGTALAGTGRRAAAAILDMAPAALIVGWWWSVPLQTALEELAVTGDRAQAEAAWADVIFWPSITFRLIYIAYCSVFELVWSRTPGKRLVGCTVIAENGGRPNWIQVLVRNATRVIELHPDPPIFLPLLLLVFVTRNRQRVGDLLARTLVVESAPVIDKSDDSAAA